jgi:hypothetical protein
MFKPIYIVRIGQRTNEIVIIAGEDISISVDRNGKRRVE